ncbi:DUF3298 domain-containing protein [Chryseobacterium fluminis]|uniref:DUF3298 domain-containing protein n=1 Tax=Chryseobacterium fluminis TaxID=2983606 RepID=UPI002250507C|nr:DUF3298 domain-containing protein [Chryseobacterium sp. MMS21-Ot14]UZT97737.1 DUF3298 domain-containing protein [Chryseobacterium sp. MMS21-Ot14]
MKNGSYAWILVLLFSIFSCKEFKDGNQEVQNEDFFDFRVDSVIEEDSLTVFDSVTMRYSSKLLVFPDLHDKKILDSIYSHKKNIKDFSKTGLQKYLKDQKEDAYALVKSLQLTPVKGQKGKWENTSQMNLRSNKNGFIHIQYYENISENGDSDNYTYAEKVIDLKNSKKVQLSDLTDISAGRMSEILRKNICNTTMMQQMAKYDPRGFNLLASSNFPVTNNFYFDEKNLYFHYNINEITTRYTIGDLIIPVPWNDLKESINSDFQQRMKIRY